MCVRFVWFSFFFFNDTATTEIYTLSLHDALRSKYFVRPSVKLRDEVNEMLGPDSYYAKVDTTLPEPAKRQWQQKETNGNGGK